MKTIKELMKTIEKWMQTMETSPKTIEQIMTTRQICAASRTNLPQCFLRALAMRLSGTTRARVYQASAERVVTGFFHSQINNVTT